MQTDPLVEWQRLSEVYRGMYDDELLNLAADAVDLTETARQVLDAELKKRGLGDLSNTSPARNIPEPRRERRAALLGNQGGAPQLVLDYRARQDDDEPLEYTWKTPLCDCRTTEQAQQLSEVLKRAGIDSWIEEPGTAFRYKGFEMRNPRVLVAADQLEQARAVAANLAPKETVEVSKVAIPEFEMPVCPNCGSSDPALEGVEPFNSWRCEACGNQWTETEGDLAAKPTEKEL